MVNRNKYGDHCVLEDSRVLHACARVESCEFHCDQRWKTQRFKHTAPTCAGCSRAAGKHLSLSNCSNSHSHLIKSALDNLASLKRDEEQRTCTHLLRGAWQTGQAVGR